MTSATILGLVPTMQSLALAGHTYKMIPKKPVSSKKQLMGLVKGTTGILVGIPLIKLSAAQVASL